MTITADGGSGAFRAGLSPDSDDLLARLLGAFAERHPQGQTLPLVSAGGLGYLEAVERVDGRTRRWPIGIAPAGVDRPTLHQFVTEIHEQYRRADEEVGSLLVHGGPPPGRDLLQWAHRRGIRVLSIVAYERGWDPAPYLQGQTARLAGDPNYPPDLYVPQRYVLFDEPPDVSPRSDALTAVVNLLTTADPRLVLIMADFGHGKSFLLRQLALRLPREMPSLVPMFVELRGLKLGDPGDLDLDRLLDAHLRRVEEDGVPAGLLRAMLERGRLVLLLDGFDELVQRLTFDEAAEYLRIITDSVQGAAKVVLTSRIAHFASDDQWRGQLGRWVRGPGVSQQLRLEPFDDRQIRDFLRHRLRPRAAAGEASPSAAEANDGALEDLVTARLSLIHGLPDLLDLSRNPRVLSFMAKFPESKLLALRAEDGTITSAGFYRALVRHWLTVEVRRRHPLRGSTGGLSVPQLTDVVTAVAIRIWADADGPAGAIELADLTGTVRATVRDLDLDLDRWRVTTDQAAFQVGSGSLLVRGDDDRFRFVHASVPEYLVAARVAENLDRTGDSPLLGQGTMSSLMVTFLLEEVGEAVTAAWVEAVRRRGRPADHPGPAGEMTWRNAVTAAAHLGLPPLPPHMSARPPSAPVRLPPASGDPSVGAQQTASSGRPLTRDEVDALVEAYGDLGRARQVVSRAGLGRGRQPADPATTELFWDEVVEALNNGAVRDGRRRLLTEAALEFPDHPVLSWWLPASAPGRG